MPVREYKPIRMPEVSTAPDFVQVSQRRVVGADVFVEWGGTVEELGHRAEAAADGSRMRLKMVSSRGTRVYPPTGAMTDVVDQWRCRFVLENGGGLTEDDLVDLLQRVGVRGSGGRTSRSSRSSTASPPTRRPRARTDEPPVNRRMRVALFWRPA